MKILHEKQKNHKQSTLNSTVEHGVGCCVVSWARRQHWVIAPRLLSTGDFGGSPCCLWLRGSRERCKHWLFPIGYFAVLRNGSTSSGLVLMMVETVSGRNLSLGLNHIVFLTLEGSAPISVLWPHCSVCLGVPDHFRRLRVPQDSHRRKLHSDFREHTIRASRDGQTVFASLVACRKHM